MRPDRAIADVCAHEILDSRGVPTLQVTLSLANGTTAQASVPSGASTGAREARELRDGDMDRYAGRGVTKACDAVSYEISHVVRGLDVTAQARIDRAMIKLDGTSDKSKLGANAILGVSLAAARAAASALDLPLYTYLGGCDARRLPVPMFNVINGGKHAPNRLDMQEFMLAPHGAPSYAEALRWGAETYHALAELLAEAGHSTAVGDEGGFAPELASDREALEFVMRAIERAGRKPGEEIAIALDPAASSFQHHSQYRLPQLSVPLMSSAELLDIYDGWVREFPIVSIEDGFAEDDWAGFTAMTARLGERVQIVGDDIFVTNPDIIKRAAAEKAATAVLIKPNQIGTLTETFEAIAACREAGLRFMISHRSGETTDDFIADLAVAAGGGQIKAGAPCRGERLAKYNRLLTIARDLGPAAEFSSPFMRQQP